MPNISRFNGFALALIVRNGNAPVECATEASLGGLPVELFKIVVQCLGVEDVLALRQTGRALLGQVNSVVWWFPRCVLEISDVAPTLPLGMPTSFLAALPFAEVEHTRFKKHIRDGCPKTLWSGVYINDMYGNDPSPVLIVPGWHRKSQLIAEWMGASWWRKTRFAHHYADGRTDAEIAAGRTWHETKLTRAPFIRSFPTVRSVAVTMGLYSTYTKAELAALRKKYEAAVTEWRNDFTREWPDTGTSRSLKYERNIRKMRSITLYRADMKKLASIQPCEK